MSAEHVPAASWRKSRRSGAQGNCVEVAELPTGEIAMRNSRDPDGPALIYTRDELAAFIAGAKDGEFDHVATDSRPNGKVPAVAADPLPSGFDPIASSPTSRPSTPGYHVIGAELKGLMETIIPGDTELDRGSSERLLRILGAVELLHRMHRVDRHGHCTICRTKPRLHWHPSSRPDTCSVYAALGLYMGSALSASSST